MNVKLLLALYLMFNMAGIKSQSLANYTAVRTTGITYSSINATGASFASWRNITANTQDDNRSDQTDIGFDFWYDGTRYTQFSISTNGFIDFSASTDDGGPQADNFGYDNTAFSASNQANATRPAIAPFYDDLTAQGGTAALGNSMKYALSGAAPNRTLTIEWLNMAVYQNVTPSLNFQVHLVEGSGKIIVSYGTMNTGTNIFSYSMGLNGPTVGAFPTAAQLKMLQTANGNILGNTVQHNLSTMPAAGSQYVFTPPVPTAVTGNLTFSGVTQVATTLNWPNWASNEVGYVIYNSTDGINYDFVQQTAANATSAAITGLLPATIYYWRVCAVTEGCLSGALSGSQGTTAAGTKLSRVTGNWSAAATWTPAGVPAAGDNVTIANGHTVSIIANGVCNNLTVGQGAAAMLQYNGGTARLLTVNSNVTVNPSASFLVNTGSNTTHSLTLEGNLVNNGTVNFATDANSLANVTFERDGSQNISGTGTNNFNRMAVNLGTAIDNVLNITSTSFSAAANFLDLTSGTLKISTGSAVSLTPFSNAVTLPQNTGLWLNAAALTMNINASATLYGKITVTAGTLNIGNAANEDLISSGGSIDITGGLLNIAGKLDGSTINNLCDFNISGGSLVVPTYGSTSTAIAPFHIEGPGSQCNMMGGSIVIQRAGGTGTQNLGFTNTGTSGAVVTGGTLQIGNAATPASQIIDINTDSQVNNLLVNSGNATARLNTNALSVRNHVTIAAGTLNANNLGLSLGGNWNNNSLFTPGTGTVTFNGASAQSIYRSGGEAFGNILFTGAGLKTFSASITASSNFSIAAGASVDVSSASLPLIVKGNFINSGSFNARSGLLMLNGTSAQVIGGSSTTDFFDITLNNTAGLTLSNAEHLKGTLTLNNGTFNTNAQVFTLLSDAANTARIAQITGTGNTSGNFTIQRFAPGGTTGWALLGSTASSSLTMNDWDDDIYISCNTCPDGSAAGFISIYTYSEQVAGAYDGATSYIPFNNINDPIVPGKGYWVYLGNGQYTTSDITLDLTGTPIKFAYPMPLNYTSHGTPADDGWNLITNPYPSAISWAALKGSTANVDNAVYVYNADLNSGTGGFASYVNGISSPAVGAGGQGDVIAMGQGFYVHTTGAATLTAQESNKVATNTTFLRSGAASGQPLLRLTLKGANASEDETVLYFEPGAHNYFDDAYDAYKMRSQTPGASFIALLNDSDAFHINGIAPVSGNFSMPLQTLTGSSGSYTINAGNISSFPAGACISLYDKFTAVTTDLRASDYVFDLEDTTTVARFTLNITLNPLSISASVSQPACTLPGSGAITAKGNSNGPWNYYWSLNGAAVRTRLNKSSADTLSGLSSGSFDLAIHTTGMCDNTTASYVISQPVQATAAFTSADTLYLGMAPLQFSNTSANASASYWDFGTTQDFSASHSPAFTYTAAGMYLVRLVVTSPTGCSDTTGKAITVLAGNVGLNTFSSATGQLVIKTLENNMFILQADLKAEAALSLSDATGRLVEAYGTQRGAFLQPVDLSNKAHGIYFLSIVSAAGKQVIKLPVK